MKIEVRFRGIENSEGLQAHAVHRLGLALDRFAGELTEAVVQLSDINGPKGGLDKRCQLTLRGPRFGVLTLHQLSGDVASAIDLACELAARNVARELDMLRGRKRGKRAFSEGNS